ncbi:immunoglobulin-like domain-containing protein [Grimontia celer]|nr:immunoglobulin-like domain-containing protein [Grimontia celer]
MVLPEGFEEIITAIEEGRDPLLVADVDPQAGEATAGSSLAPQAVILANSLSVLATAGFDTDIALPPTTTLIQQTIASSLFGIQSQETETPTIPAHLQATLLGSDTVAEGDSATYTISLSEPAETDVTITISVQHKTSESDDIIPVQQQLVIPKGQTQATFTVDILDDPFDENDDDDSFEVSIIESVAADSEQIVDSSAPLITTILDEDTEDLKVGEDIPMLTLSGDSSVEEGESANYLLELSETPHSDMEITVTITHVSSESGDIATSLQTVTIPEGSNSVSFTVATLNDVYDESTDTDVFKVEVTGSTGGDFEGQPDAPQAIETTIEDSATKDAPTLTLTGDTSVSEGASASYTLTLSEAPNSDFTVTVTVGHKTTEDGDIQPVTRNVLIAANTTSVNFSVDTLDDSLNESVDDDVFTVSVDSTSGGDFEAQPTAPAAVETTINDGTTADSPTLTLTGDASVNEGEAASYTLTLSEAPTADFTVTVVVGHKTSEDGDVTPVTRDVVIAANSTSVNFTVDTLDDSLNESVDDDVFTVSVDATSGGDFEAQPSAPAAVETTINDGTTTDAPTLTLTGDASVNEGESASYTLTLSEAPTADFTVTVVVGHKTSEDGDITPVTRDVVIAAGTISTNFTVDTLDDSLNESADDDVFTVSVDSTTGGDFEAQPTAPAAVETAINDGTTTDAPTLTLTGDASVNEGESASYTLTLSEAPTSDFTVTVVVGHKTSEDGDVMPVTRDVVIAANTTSVNFTVDTLDDSLNESADDDVFTVSVDSTTGGDFEAQPTAPAAVETTINDGTTTDAPTLTLTGDASVNEGESASYTLTLSEAPTADFIVTVVVGHKTSEDGDVTPVTRDVVIAANSTSVNFTVDTLDDSLNESADDDVFTVSVDSTSGGDFEAQPTAPTAVETTINDGTTTDAPTLTLTGDASVNEGESASYTLTLSEAPTADFTVTVVVGHKTSEDGDVTPVTRDVVIVANTTSVNFTVDTLDDSLNESADDDVFTVSVNSTSGGDFEAQPTAPTAVETTINDGTTDDAPTLTLTGDASVNEGEAASYTLTLSEAPTADFTVTVVVGHKTSEDGDVTPVTRDVVIAANTTSVNFTVDTLDDSLNESADDDVFTVSVNSTTGGDFESQPTAPAAVETTINDGTTADAPTLTLTGDASVNEGESASYTLTLSEAPTADFTVTVVVGHKTSEDGDVTPVTRDVVIAANTTSVNFTVDTLDDSLNESADDDVFTVSVDSTAGGDFEAQPTAPAAVETTINDGATKDAPTLTLNGDASVIEGGSASYTLTLSEAPTADFTVTVVIGHKTTEDGDVTPVTRDVVIAAGTTSVDFTVDTLDDSLNESADDDVFTVSVNTTTGGDFEAQPTAPSAVETTINDGTTTDAPTLTLTGDASVNEGEAASYTLTLSEAPTADFTVTVVIGHKTSEDGDVTPVARDVVIIAGTTSVDFTVDTLNDSLNESADDDVFTVSVDSTSGGDFEAQPTKPAAVETTINDGTTTDAPTLILTGDASVNEGESASYTLTISEAPTADFTVTIVVGHKTTEDGDVTPVTRDVVIAAGTTSVDFTVDTLNDSLNESADDDVFTVSVDATSGGDFETQPTAPATVETTINDGTTTDAPTLALTGDASVIEGGSASYTLTLSEAPTADFTVTVVVGHKTSEDGDVTPVTRDVVIAAGTTSVDFTVDTLDDSLDESADDDVFTVSVNSTTGGGFEAQPTAPAAVETTINDGTTTDAPTLTLTGDASVNEGEAASYTLTLSEAPTADFTVTVVVGHKTSEDGDVTPVTRDVVIAAGTTSIDFTVDTLDDSLNESADDDVFTVSVNATSGGDFEAQPTAPAAVETTINDGATTDAPTLTLTGDTSVNEGESASFTLTLSEAPTADFTVTIVVGHETTEDGDVTPMTRDVVIAANTTSINFTVDTLDDSLSESADDDVFTVSVSATSGGDFESQPTAPAAVETTINDGTTTDAPTLTLTGDTSVNEGEAASYTLTLSEAPTSDFTVTVVIGHKTTEDGDVTPVTRDVVITAGTTSADFTVDTLDDSLNESADDDVFTVSVNAISGGDFEAQPTAPATVETTINDGTTTDAPTLTLTGDASVNEGESASYTLTISETPTADFTVTVVIGHKTSENGDVIPVTRDVVITAGTTSVDFTVDTLDDSLNESADDDVFTVSVDSTTGGNFEDQPTAPAAVETTINDGTTTDAPTLTLTGDASVNEGEAASYTLTLSEAPTSDFTVTVVVGHKTSEDGDVTPVTRDVVITSGTTSVDFTVDTLDDSLNESADNDVFTVSVDSTSGGDFEAQPTAPAAVETTINDGTTTDAPTLTLTGDASVNEGESASYTLTLSEAPTSDFTVTVVVGHKTSEDGDVTPVTRDVVIAANTTSVNFTVDTLDDSLNESSDDDVFTVSVDSTTGGDFEAQPTAPTAVETTINDGTTTDAPTLTLTGDASVNEGESASYTLTLSEAPTADFTVTVVVGHKTSEDGDVTPVTRDVVIAANTTSVNFTVDTLDDSLNESTDDDVFTVSVDSTSGGDFEAQPTAPAAVETTINDGATKDAPTLTLNGDASVIEGGSASYTLTLSEAPTADFTVTVVIGHKTTEDGDVTPVTRDVVIAAGTTSVDFTVDTLDDSLNESADDDVFTVSVDSTTGGDFEAQPSAPAAVETTINDGTTTDAPTLTLTGDASVNEGESASYTLTLSEAPTADFTVTVVVGHKTSEDGDVTPVTRDVVITANTTSVNFTVDTLDDQLIESSDNDVFTVSVSTTSGGNFEAQPTAPNGIETSVTANDTAALVEDVGAQSISGVLQVLASDGVTELQFDDTTSTGTYGQLALVSGEWTYTLGANAQTLDEDQVVNETITLTATDGSTHQVTVVITGTEDVPEVSGTLTGSVDAVGFYVDTNNAGSVTGEGTSTSGPINAGWTTTSTTINGVPYVVSTQWGISVSTFIYKVNNDGSLTETDRITYDQSTNTVTTTSGGDVTADVTALGISPNSLGNGLTQSNISNIDGNTTLFVTSQNSRSLTAWEIAPDGTLSINGGVTNIHNTDGQSYLRENVVFEGEDGTEYVFVTRPGTDNISTLTYDPVTGDFTNLNRAVFGGDLVSSIDVYTDNNGNTWLVASSNDQVRIYSVNANDGTLTFVDSESVNIGVSNSVNFYETSDGRLYAIYTNNSSDLATIYEVDSSGNLTLTDTISGAGHYFASASYIDGEPVFVMPNQDSGVDLYTIDESGSLVLQSTITGISNDWTSPVIVQTEDGSHYLVDADGNTATVKLKIGNQEEITVSGSIAITDIDTNDQPEFQNTVIEGKYGTLELIDGDWTYTLDKDKVSSLEDDEVAQDVITLTATDGTTQDVVIDVTGHQPVEQFVQGTNTGSIVVDLAPDAASPGFEEDAADGTVSFSLADYTSDLIDDADNSDALTTSINITSLPDNGTLYYLDAGGNQIAVAVGDTLPDDTNFVFEPDKVSKTFSSSDITSSTQSSIVTDGMTVSGGTFSGIKPDLGSMITDAPIVWEFTNGEDGLGIGSDRELDSVNNEVMTFEFTNGLDVTSTDIVVASAFGNFSDTRPANATVNFIALKDGQIVNEFTFANIWEASGLTGNATLNISDGSGYDELRMYISASVNSNLTVTSVSTVALDTTDTSFTYKAVNSLGNESDVATITLGDAISDTAEQRTPPTVSGTLVLADSSGTTTGIFPDTTEQGQYGSAQLVNGNWTYTLDPTLLSNIPDGQTLQDTITFTANDGTTSDIQVVIGESGSSIASYYATDVTTGLSDLVDLSQTTAFGGSEDDLLSGLGDEDIMLGLAGNDALNGGAGNDTLDGGEGNDILTGGQGDDILFGGDDSDIFAFNAGDQGTGATPAQDQIADFDTSLDTLSLADLLQGESEENIGDYLSVFDNANGDAVINVASSGASVDQTIALDNVSVSDLATAYGVDSTGLNNDQISSAVIDAMITQSKIIID